MKQHNLYMAALGPDYRRIPKAVLAAVAVSFATMLQSEGTDEERLANARNVIRKEWGILHTNGIVPQRPGIARHAT